MAFAKDTHYWIELRKALTAGEWGASFPGKAPNGSLLSWPELLRKFRKHCSQHADFVEAVSQTQALSLLLSPDGLTSSELDGDGMWPNGHFGLGNECLLAEERREEAEKCYETLRVMLDSKGSSVKHASAYFAFALGQQDNCLTQLEGVSWVQPTNAHTSNLAMPDANDPGVSRRPSPARNPQPSIGSALAVPGALISGAVSHTGRLPSSLDIEDGQAWEFIQTIRSHCLQGLSHEILSPQSPSTALSAYETGVALLAAVSIPRSLPNRAGRANFESFTRYRELWRWTERLLWRVIVLSSRYQPFHATTRLFQVYAAHSVHWPASFRPQHRSTVLTLHIHALVRIATSPRNKSTWTNEMRAVIHEFRAILTSTTRFPRSGERNVAVEDFVDLCVALWEAGGAVGDQAGWVLDILWWATRLTFNSQRVFRHMTRLLEVAGEQDLAKRTLRLYVQITNKARETGVSESEDESGADSDQLWVQTLVQGARMLCRLPGDVAEAREALHLAAQARARVGDTNPELAARVDLAEGICKSTLALREQEPSTRDTLLTESLALIGSSLGIHPTPAAHYHAAVGLARPGVNCNLPLAIQHAGLAVEGSGKEVRFWHLLALLAAKSGEWKKAKGVLEVAAELTEDIIVEPSAEEPKSNKISIRDFAAENGGPEQHQSPELSDGLLEPLVSPSEDQLPLASSILKPIQDHPTPSPRDLFEHALQLRMTTLALTEYVDGPERADSKWLEVFEWYAARKDTAAPTRSARQSFDGRPSVSNISHTPEPASMGPSLGESQQPLPVHEEETPIEAHHENHEPPTISIDNGSTHQDPDSEKLAGMMNGPRKERRSQSLSPERERDRDRDTSKGKKVQKMLKDRVNKGQARINTISKKIGSGVVRGGSLHRSTSVPDFHAALTRAGPYQASSIHSRKRVISWGSKSIGGRNTPSPVPSLPLPPLPPPQDVSVNSRSARDRRLLSDLWLMSAATFRRLGKIEQARGAIREAEVQDEENEAVWVQLGLYFSALGDTRNAIESFHKALFIAPDDPSAVVHLCRQYLSPDSSSNESLGAVDLAVGMLEDLTRGVGWDVPEAWYLLAKAYGTQGRKGLERDCLAFALGLVETRGVREVGAAVGCCL